MNPPTSSNTPSIPIRRTVPSPICPYPAPSPTPAHGERHLRADLPEGGIDPELVYAVQTGSNLTGWSDAGIADIEEISLVDNHDGTETVTVRDRTPLSATSRRYFQMKRAAQSSSPGRSAALLIDRGAGILMACTPASIESGPASRPAGSY